MRGAITEVRYGSKLAVNHLMAVRLIYLTKRNRRLSPATRD